MDKLKANKEDIKLYMAQLIETPGWKVFDAWLLERLEIYKDQTIETLSLGSKGRVEMIKEIYQQLKDYAAGK